MDSIASREHRFLPLQLAGVEKPRALPSDAHGFDGWFQEMTQPSHSKSFNTNKICSERWKIP